MRSSASLAGACTICGRLLPSVRAALGCAVAPAGSVGAGRATLTHPVTVAETATVSRSAAVVVGRCTRPTLRRARPIGVRTGQVAPHG